MYTGEDIKQRQQELCDNILKGFGSDTSEDSIEKARHGVYADTPENRKLNRVGREYGKSSKKEDKKESPMSAKPGEYDFENEEGETLAVRVYKDGGVKASGADVRKDFNDVESAAKWLKQNGYTKQKEVKGDD